MSTGMDEKHVDPRLEVKISYCPELGIYHYIRSDGDEFFFDDDKLEQSIMVYRSQNMTTDADRMALLTAYARTNPHKIVFCVGGKPPRVESPVPHVCDDEGKSSGDVSPKPGKRG